MKIGRKDVLWSYAATFLQIGAGVILLPFILRVFPQETVAIWVVFATITALSNMLDFGFNLSFARNISYVVTGVKELKKTGFQIVENHNNDVDYGLFKGLISAMRWFYGRIALILLILLTTVGTYYISVILKNYSHCHTEIYWAWAILCVANSYHLYTLYYDSLLQGQGLVMKAKQLQIIGQLVYLFVAVVLIALQANLIAIVSAQALSILVRRVLSYRVIYTSEFKQKLRSAIAQSRKEILKVISPNAIKAGLTGVGGILVMRSSVIIGALYLSLDTIASYGITIQIITIIAGLSMVYFSAYQPKIVQLRAQNHIPEIKRFYVKSSVLLLITYIVLGTGLLWFGDWLLGLINSQTPLLNKSIIALALVFSLLESNHSIAGGFLLTKNEVPFFRASLFAGAITVLLLFVFFECTQFGIWALILAPGLAQACYQNWKWPMVVMKDFKKFDTSTEKQHCEKK